MDGAYLEGYAAYNSGHDAEVNPYVPGSPDFKAWHEGYCNAGFDDCDQLLDVSDAASE